MHKDYAFLDKLYKYANIDKKNIKNLKNIMCKSDNSLEWFNYLLYTEAYLTKFKLYVFLSVYDKNIKLDKNVLSLSYDYVNDNLKTDFVNIYRYCKTKLKMETKIFKTNNQGWVKYNNYKKLSNDLKGYTTNFGIEGYKSSKLILENNNVDIYYLDNVPVILLLYNKYSIINIKLNCNILIIKDILIDKVKEFINCEFYLNLINNSIKLEEINKKFEYGLFFNKEDLMFLYEIEFITPLLETSKIKEKIIKKRNIKEDMAIIFECNINKIGINKEDLNNDLLVYIGDIKDSRFPKYVIGNIYINDVKELPYYVKGNIYSKCNEIKDFVLPSILIGNIDFEDVIRIENVVFPSKVNGNLYLDSTKELINVKLPNIANDIYLESLQYIEHIQYPDNYKKVYLSNRLNENNFDYKKVKVYN